MRRNKKDKITIFQIADLILKYGVIINAIIFLIGYLYIQGVNLGFTRDNPFSPYSYNMLNINITKYYIVGIKFLLKPTFIFIIGTICVLIYMYYKEQRKPKIKNKILKCLCNAKENMIKKIKIGSYSSLIKIAEFIKLLIKKFGINFGCLIIIYFWLMYKTDNMFNRFIVVLIIILIYLSIIQLIFNDDIGKVKLIYSIEAAVILIMNIVLFIWRFSRIVLILILKIINYNKPFMKKRAIYCSFTLFILLELILMC